MKYSALTRDAPFSNQQTLNSIKQLNTIMRILVIGLIVIFFIGCKHEQPAAPPPVTAEVVTINTATAITETDYAASLEGKVNVEIRPQVDGHLETVFVDEGAYVQAGQSLFKINELPYREQYNSAKASLHAAEAAVAHAQLEIDKLTPLVHSKVMSDIQLKTLNNAHRLALANVEQARAAVAAAQINLGYTLIKAPVSGFIGRLPKKQGSLVSRSDVQALTQLSDVQDVYAYFSLSEADFIRFKAQYNGNTMTDKLNNLPPVSLVLADNSVYPVAGKINMVDGQFDKNTGAITLRATFPNKDGLLRSGNTGKVRLSLPHTDAIMVPASATIEIQDKVFVYAVGDSNKVSKHPITLIGKSGTDYLVKDGIKAGDRIVFSGLDHLQEGLIVQPEKPKSAAQLTMNK